MKPVSKPKYAAPPNAEVSTPHQRRGAKWADLHSALAQLVEARSLAAENSETEGDVQ